MKGLRQEYYSRIKKGGKSALRGEWVKLSVESNWTLLKRRPLLFQPRTQPWTKKSTSSHARKAQTQTDGRKASKSFGPRDKVLLEGKARKRKKKSSKDSVRIRRVIFGILPNVKNYKSVSECNFGDQCPFRHTEAVSNCGSGNGPKVATYCGSSQWSSPCERNNEGEGVEARAVCGRGQAQREQQLMRMRHGVLDVKVTC